MTDGARRRLAIVLTPLAFAEILGGNTLPIPLIPYYDQAVGLGAGGAALMLNAYLVTLVATLAVLAHPRMQRHPAIALIVGLVAAIAADVALSIETIEALVLGRVLHGLAVALATGATAALVLALIGERGRTVTATGNMLGALVGTALSVVTFEITRGIIPIYAIHGVLTLATLIGLAIALPAVGRSVTAPEPEVRAATDHATERGRSGWFGYLCGGIAWAAQTIVLTFLPLTMQGSFDFSSLLATSTVLLVFAGASIGQFLFYSPDRPRRTAILSLGLLAGGLVAVAIGVIVASPVLLIAASVLVGLGQGPGYRLGLRIVTRGASPIRQGTLASRYAWTSYGTTAVAVAAAALIAGPLGTDLGLITSTFALVPVAIAIGVVVLVHSTREIER